jgi:hypothetical protein
MRVFLAGTAAALVTATLVAGTSTAPGRTGSVVHGFRLGPIEITQPGLSGRFTKLPIRLDGVLALPAGTRPAPLVVVVHGAHLGCSAPLVNDVQVWPCPENETIRNYAGFRTLQRALAKRDIASVSVDVNASFTDGWGEPNEVLRTPLILDAYLTRLAAAVRGTGLDFGVPLEGRLDFARLGILGHSRSGGQAVAIAKKRNAKSGPGRHGEGAVRGDVPARAGARRNGGPHRQAPRSGSCSRRRATRAMSRGRQRATRCARPGRSPSRSAPRRRSRSASRVSAGPASGSRRTRRSSASPGAGMAGRTRSGSRPEPAT